MSTRFVPNPHAAEDLQQTEEYKAAMAAIAIKVAAEVEDAAPHVTGYYEGHIAADGATVVASDPFWHLVEFGSINNPPYAPLRRGVVAAGLRFVDTGRTASAV